MSWDSGKINEDVHTSSSYVHLWFPRLIHRTWVFSEFGCLEERELEGEEREKQGKNEVFFSALAFCIMPVSNWIW